jgi:hypothetical protein
VDLSFVCDSIHDVDDVQSLNICVPNDYEVVILLSKAKERAEIMKCSSGSGVDAQGSISFASLIRE